MNQSEIIEFAKTYNARQKRRAGIAALRAVESTFGKPGEWGYLDEDKNVVRCQLSDLLERYPDADPLGPNGMTRRVGKDTVRNTFLVSTVFLALDHGCPPWSYPHDAVSLWFETMVFHGRRSLFEHRYATFQEALAGHERVLAQGWARTGWARWVGYSQSHLRKIRREQKARASVG